MSIYKEDPFIPEAEKRLLQKYEDGQQLKYIIELPGYAVILNILREEIESSKRKLVSYRDSEAQQAFRLLAEMQGQQKLLTTLESTVASRTGLVNEPPAEIARYVSI